MFTFLLTRFTISRDSDDSAIWACRPVTSSSNTTPKLYTSICSVAFLLNPYSAIKNKQQELVMGRYLKLKVATTQMKSFVRETS